MFTLLANTKDVRVSTYNTTLKRVYEYLMTTIKERPDNVIESLKLGKLITVPEPTIKVLNDHVAKEGDKPEETATKQAMVKSMNQAYQVDFANELQERRNQQDLLNTNMKQTYTYIFSKFCDKELQIKIENRSNFRSNK